jgi:hypothetical protein
VYSCKKEDDCPTSTTVQKDSLIISFQVFSGNLPLAYLSPFNDALNRSMRVDLLKHYVSNVYLLNGTKEILIKDVAFLTYLNNGEPDPGDELQKIRLRVPVGTYTGIRFAIGLDSAMNKSNPSSFPDEHPLSAKQLTYWGAWQNYKFLMIEGFTDFDGDKVFSDPFGFHTGLDYCYRERTFDKNITVKKGQVAKLNFNFEINDLFFGTDTLDLATESSWHGDTLYLSRGIRLSENFINALWLD